MFTDTHCHLFGQYYDDISQVVSESEKLGVNRYINNATDKKSILEVIELCNIFPNMYGAIGIHPEDIKNFKIKDLELLERHIMDEKIVAVGEIGLDYYYSKEDRELQIDLFLKQLELAGKYNKPVIIHSREATQDMIEILGKYNVKGVIHSFSGSYETACTYIKMGFLLGVNGVVTFKNAKLKDVIKKVGVNNIVLETDSPYLTPEPFRGKKNFPGRINEIAEFLSDLFEISKDELAEITNENIKRIFDI